MKTLGLVVTAFALFGVGAPAEASAPTASVQGSDLSTDRRIHGVITSIEPAKLTIASSLRAVSGSIDPARTKVTVNGRPGKLSDLKLTDHAKGELCLDDVWLAIDTH